jgi:hypothetical protein
MNAQDCVKQNPHTPAICLPWVIQGLCGFDALGVTPAPTNQRGAAALATRLPIDEVVGIQENRPEPVVEPATQLPQEELAAAQVGPEAVAWPDITAGINQHKPSTGAAGGPIVGIERMHGT